MATVCLSALPSGDTMRRNRLLNLTRSLASKDNVSLVLYGDGVYNLINGSQAAAEMAEAPVTIYAIAEDIELRGLTGKIVPQAQQVDYGKVVDLVMEADHTITGL
ncbi:MAG: sulfurtransferase complex subunit TusB [Actinomycetota bacterium]|nr:sulfurtransferase complex subunit TusB [Actinomycetota bacterium]